MKPYFVKTPKIIRSFYKDYIWNKNTHDKEIYLTFDDGPTEKITPFVLETLKKYNAKATFFCIGKNIINHPVLFQQIVDDGHTIGNHTHNHFNGWLTKTSKYIENVLHCETTINNACQKSSITHKKRFRPPYGKIKKTQARALINKGYDIVMWDILSADFDTTISKEKCLENVISKTENGSILVFHDSVKSKPNLDYVLPKILDYFSKKGFSFKNL